MSHTVSAFMPFFVAEYLADTLHLSTIEHGAYMLLIMHYWRHGKAISDTRTSIAKIARMTVEEWDSAAPTVRPFFKEAVIDAKPVLVHNKVERELAHARGLYEQKKTAGRASAEAKRLARERLEAKGILNERSTDVEPPLQRKTNGVDIPLPTDGQREANNLHKNIEHSSDEERKKCLSETQVSDAPSLKSSKRRQPYPPQFEEFWRAYPTDPNMAKLKAFQQWKRLVPDEQDAAIRAVPAFRRYCEDNAKTGYRPLHAERFLSQHRFDGFLSATASNGAGAGDPELARLQEAAARRREEKARVSEAH